MKNSKWVKLVSKEDILSLKEDAGFKFCSTNLSKHFNISDKRMGELLKFYEIEVQKLTKNVKLTTEEWIKDCKSLHREMYDYSKSIYVNAKTPIIIGCPIHGFVEVSPSRHKNGSHCKRCSAKERSIFKPLSKEVFLEEAKITHNNKYDYSLVENFETVNDKITIICPVHGKFRQRLHSHRKGYGCDRCAYEEKGKEKRVSFEDYIIRAEDKFGKLYKYLENSYTKISEDITYICDIHGEVTQSAGTHLISRGCAKCFRRNERSNTEKFIDSANLAHNYFYTYPDTIYGKSNSSNVLIKCPFHGDFLQTPNSHLNGAGCKVCANIKSNIGFKELTKEDILNSKNIKCVLYLLKFKTNNLEYYKIGISTNFKKRLIRLKGSHKATIEIVYKIESNLFDCAKKESELLNKYKKYNRRGEVPFGIDGSTECLSVKTPVEEIISYLESI